MLKDVLITKGLSRREIEVATLVSRGMTNKQAANTLFITEKTIKFHLTNIYRKMRVKSRSQLIVWCMPYFDFEDDKIEAQKPQKIVVDDTQLMPIGISKVGNA